MWWAVPKLWTGQTVAVLASGESMTADAAAAVQHLPRIAVNSTFKLAPDADLIYAADRMWWRLHREEVEKLPGLRVSVAPSHGDLQNYHDWVMYLRDTGTIGYDSNPASIRTGGNSSYQALHIAVQAGAAKVLLLGVDMCGSHWHGRHKPPLGNPGAQHFQQWTRYFERMAHILRTMGVDVVNCSEISTLTCFRRSRLEDEL